MNERLRAERALKRAENEARAYKSIEYPVWLSSDEAARYLGVTARTLHEVAVPGGLPCYRFGRVFRFKLEDLQRFIERSQVGPEGGRRC